MSSIAVSVECARWRETRARIRRAGGERKLDQRAARTLEETRQVVVQQAQVPGKYADAATDLLRELAEDGEA